jgi:transcription antitermination factor NusG
VQNEVKCRWDSTSGSYDGTTSALLPEIQCSPVPDRRDNSPQWFAIETRHRFEKKVIAQLLRKGFASFLPLLTEQHEWSDRHKIVTIPLFPGYAFVYTDQSRGSSQTILQTTGVIRFVSFAGSAATVPRKQIEDLQLLLQQKGSFSLHSFVHAGQRVRIREGCLRGLEGILVQNERNKLVISIQCIQRSLAIEIQGYEVELV